MIGSPARGRDRASPAPTRWRWRPSVPARRSRRPASPGRSPGAAPAPRPDRRSAGPIAAAATALPAARSPRGRGRTGRTTRRGRRPRSAARMSPRSTVSSKTSTTPEPSVAAGRARPLEGQGHVQPVRPDEHARGAAEQHRADALPARDPAGHRDQLAERDAEIDLVDARPRDVPGDAEELRPGRPRRPDAGVGLAALQRGSAGCSPASRRC